MRKAIRAVDIGDLPALVRLAEEVEQSGQPRLLTHRGREIAVLTPVEAARHSARPARRRGRQADGGDPFGGLIGIGDTAGAPDDPTDVAQYKHKYLADAYDIKRA